jgi:hypothetical protein
MSKWLAAARSEISCVPGSARALARFGRRLVRQPEDVPGPRRQRRIARRTAVLCIVLSALALGGCATGPPATSDRPFVFQKDTFAFANELVWEYRIDPVVGKTPHQARQPPPTYTHHCFVMARTVRQFFEYARFDPEQPVVDDAAYRTLIRRVVSRNPRRSMDRDERIVIPGYADLYDFSRAHEAQIKAECGGAWQSYCQRGHWRMVMPMGPAHQQRIARQLLGSLERNRPAVVHLVRFPSLAINHALVLFEACATERQIHFRAYDPNTPRAPVALTYDRVQRAFEFPRTAYFAGGPVKVYEIFHAWNY